MTTNNGFGTPRFGGGGSFKKPIKLQPDTTTVVRILPPMKSCADTGEWAVYLGTHYGYKGVNKKDPSKPIFRTFLCIEEKDFQTQMITQDCPESDLIAAREKDLEDLEAAAKAQGHSEDEIAELAKPLKDWLKDHNCDRKWHMNVMTEQGEVNRFEISHKTKKLLEKKIQELLTEDGIEALAPDQGVWFKFHRAGKGIAAQDTVDVVYESIKDEKGRVSRTVKMAPLTQAQAEKALKEGQDLHTVVRKISYEQIKLLTTCSGEPEDVDAIFAMGEKKKERSAPPAPSKPAPKPEKPVEKPVESVPAQDTAEDDEEAALEAALARAKAKKAEAAAAAAQAASQAPAVEKTPVAETKPSEPAKPSTAPAAGGAVDRAAFMARFKKPGQQ